MKKVDRYQGAVTSYNQQPQDIMPDGYEEDGPWEPIQLVLIVVPPREGQETWKDSEVVHRVLWRRPLRRIDSQRSTTIPWDRGCVLRQDEHPTTGMGVKVLPGFSQDTPWALVRRISYGRAFWRCSGHLDLGQASDTLHQYQIAREPEEQEVPQGYTAESWRLVDSAVAPPTLGSQLWTRILRRSETKQ